MTTSTYNGWANYETWNVALRIQNDQILFSDALESAQYRTAFHNLLACIEAYGSQMKPDGVRWTDGRIDEAAINQIIKEPSYFHQWRISTKQLRRKQTLKLLHLFYYLGLPLAQIFMSLI